MRLINLLLSDRSTGSRLERLALLSSFDLSAPGAWQDRSLPGRTNGAEDLVIRELGHSERSAAQSRNPVVKTLSSRHGIPRRCCAPLGMTNLSDAHQP